MDTILAYLIGFGPLVLMVLAALLGLIVFVVLGLTKPAWLVLGYILIFIFFSQSTHGLVGGSGGLMVYGKAAGFLFFPLDYWLLWTLLLLSVVSDGFAGQRRAPIAIKGWIIAIALLQLAHMAVAPFFGIGLQEAASSLGGLITLVNMGLLAMLLSRVYASESDVQWLLDLVVFAVLCRAGFGLVRWVGFGGDPANVYENSLGTGTKLTFFDIADNLFATVVAFYCAFRLAYQGGSFSAGRRFFYWLSLALTLGVVLLSFRRTAYTGLVLAGLLLLAVYPARKRLVLALAAIPLLGGGFMLLLTKRLMAESNGQRGLEAFVYDLTGGTHYNQESLRDTELKHAFDAFLESPIWGQGTWGRFAADSALTWQQGDSAFGFVHSAVVHMLFKSGLIGAALVLGLLLSFLFCALKMARGASDPARALIFAGLAGWVFMIPSILFGPTFIETRSTQAMGICMALPFLARAFDSTRRLAVTA